MTHANADAYGHSPSLLDDEERAIREVVREFAVEELRPGAREADETETFPEEAWDKLAALDLTGLTVPEAYGGFDADRSTYAIVNEELAYGHLAVATALSVHCLAASCIASFGSEAVKDEWLPELVDGRPVGAFCLSEPGAGSNPAQMATTAEHDGDEYVINGEKQWITNGERAGVYIVFAKADPEDDASITQFLVPADLDGVEVGKKEEKLGLRASDTVGMQFSDVRVPERYRLTEEGKGLSAAFKTLTGGRIAIAAQAVGLAQAAFDEAREYAHEREQFDAPIAEIEAVRNKFAEMATTVQASRLLVREAARQSDAGEDPRLAASMAKYFASESAVDVTNEAVQIHGGYGYMSEFDVERLYRDSKITTIYEGTTEIQKTIIARELL
ncbi:acyl-CoA dehydrogenase family protein [Halobaculum halobium]|uniref:Acyl-CoA dehydrogenase family protein n=1 Tax=Halobaculum halobium TaxID=3032281 RepID=A0ABD5T820_9EURY|nr:acyl-CoA dehydrogenase family protein [Halobaculum sp. SYNS20]